MNIVCPLHLDVCRWKGVYSRQGDYMLYVEKKEQTVTSFNSSFIPYTCIYILHLYNLCTYIW